MISVCVCFARLISLAQCGMRTHVTRVKTALVRSMTRRLSDWPVLTEEAIFSQTPSTQLTPSPNYPCSLSCSSTGSSLCLSIVFIYLHKYICIPCLEFRFSFSKSPNHVCTSGAFVQPETTSRYLSFVLILVFVLYGFYLFLYFF